MGNYRITNGQNLYDVAMHIYGSIEGITDLLICNPKLSMASDLKSGDELIYTDDLIIDADTVAYLRRNNIVPANGERHVYFKEAQSIQVMEVRAASGYTSAEFSASGTGFVEVDWGDNTPLEKIELVDDLTTYHHSFDNTISTLRKIRFYGDFRLRQLDITALHPSSVFVLSPIYIGELSICGSSASLDFLPMLRETYRIDLSDMKVRDLSPLVECRDLRWLDLSRIDTLQETLDNYLIALVREHYGRRSCAVTLTETPSGEYAEPSRDEDLNYKINTGMEALWLLVNEPAWNEGGLWSFDINGSIFINEQDY